MHASYRYIAGYLADEVSSYFLYCSPDALNPFTEQLAEASQGLDEANQIAIAYGNVSASPIAFEIMSLQHEPKETLHFSLGTH